MPSAILFLTRELGAQIISAVRSGGYPHVAAEAFGVARETFDAWMEQGARKDADDVHREFVQEVRQSFAQARLRAEIEQHKDNPKLWLIHGPGRESDDDPGWSASVRASETKSNVRNALVDLELMEILRELAATLEPFAPAREAVLEMLTDRGLDLAA